MLALIAIADVSNAHCYCAFAGLVPPHSLKLGQSHLHYVRKLQRRRAATQKGDTRRACLRHHVSDYKKNQLTAPLTEPTLHGRRHQPSRHHDNQPSSYHQPPLASGHLLLPAMLAPPTPTSKKKEEVVGQHKQEDRREGLPEQKRWRPWICGGLGAPQHQGHQGCSIWRGEGEKGAGSVDLTRVAAARKGSSL
jgi:hypothetical protein